MSVSEIVELIHPPSQPKGSGNGELWEHFLSQMEFPLPSDYREYLENFGVGQLGNLFYVSSPFEETQYNFLKTYMIISDDLELRCEDEGWLRNAKQNNLLGLIRFGSDTNMNFLHWLTDGEPDQWPIIVGGGSSWRVSKYDGPFTSFFAGVLRSEVATDRYSPNLVKLQFRQ